MMLELTPSEKELLNSSHKSSIMTESLFSNNNSTMMMDKKKITVNLVDGE